MSKFFLISIFIVITSPSVFSQHIDIDKKALSFMASEEKMNVVFTFDNLSFDGKEVPETEFLQKRYLEVSEWKDKEAATEWLLLYDENKKNQWQESFMVTLNEKTAEYKNAPVFSRNDDTAKYTIQVNSYWMYFGYDVIIGKEPSKVSMKINFYETENPSNILFTTDISRAMGTNNESYNLSAWPSYRRMGKAYTRASYKLAQAFQRVLD